MTIRERIQAYQGEILKGDLLPERAATILAEIAALMGNILEEITTREIIYNKFLLETLDNEKTAVRAKIKAETSSEYESMKTAQNIEKVAEGLIRGLKYFLKAKESEYQSSKYQ